MIGSRCILNGAHTNHFWVNLAQASKLIKNSDYNQKLQGFIQKGEALEFPTPRASPQSSQSLILQWNLSIRDNIGTNISVLIIGASSFQGWIYIINHCRVSWIEGFHSIRLRYAESRQVNQLKIDFKSLSWLTIIVFTLKLISLSSLLINLPSLH